MKLTIDLNTLTIVVESEASAGTSTKLQLQTIMDTLDELRLQVERTAEVQASAIALLVGLKAKLDAAGTNAEALKELSDAIGAQTDALAAAVAANTVPTESVAPTASPAP